MSTLTVTGWLLPLVTMPDCGSTVSQLDPSLVALDALHCKGSFPGLLTVTICPGGSTLPSVPVKVSTGGVSWTASCSGRSGSTPIFTGRVIRPAFDLKITLALYDPTLRFERLPAIVTCMG